MPELIVRKWDGPYSFMIFREYGVYKARRGDTGEAQFEDKNGGDLYQAVFEALSEGGLVYAKHGICEYNQTLKYPPNLMLIGENRNTTRFMFKGSGYAFEPKNKNDGIETLGVYMARFTVEGGDSTAPSGGIDLSGVKGAVLHEVLVREFANSDAIGILLNGYAGGVNVGCYYNWLSHVHIGYVGHTAIKLTGDYSYSPANTNDIVHPVIHAVKRGIDVDAGSSVRIFGGSIEGFSEVGVRFNQYYDQLYGTYLESHYDNVIGIHITSNARSAVIVPGTIGLYGSGVQEVLDEDPTRSTKLLERETRNIVLFAKEPPFSTSSTAYQETVGAVPLALNLKRDWFKYNARVRFRGYASSGDALIIEVSTNNGVKVFKSTSETSETQIDTDAFKLDTTDEWIKVRFKSNAGVGVYLRSATLLVV